MKSKSLKFLTGAFALSLAITTTGHAAIYIWNGGGGPDSNWNTKQNWNTPNPPPNFSSTHELQFGGSNKTGPIMEASYEINKLTFNSGAAAFTLTSSGNSVLTIFAGGIVNNDDSIQTINITTITLGASQTWNAGTVTGGSLVFSGTTVNLGVSQTLTIDGSNTTSIVNQITGTGTSGIIKNGSGTLTLSGNNTYAGVTTINNGVLNIQNSNALGGTGSGTSVVSGAALSIQNGITTAAEALTLNGTGILGGGALRNISGTNTYAGAITLNSATRINSDSGMLDLNVTAGSAITGANQDVTFGGVGNVTVSDAITTGSGSLTKDGNGTLTLSASNTYTGNTTINAGTLALASTGSIASGSAVIKVESGATFNVSAVSGYTVNGTSAVARQLLTGSGGVTGATTIGSFGAHNASGSGVGTQAFSSSLTYNSGSIFQWDLDVQSPSAEVHDQVTATSLGGSGAEFKILLGAGDSFADAFWNSTRNWAASDLFGASNANVDLSTIFSSATTTANFTANSLEGLFSFTSTGGGTGNQLTWTAVPEPTSALAGILLGAGLLRRRRI